jgi:hypothetical protein
MLRTILTQVKTVQPDVKTFECTREDFFIALFALGKSFIRAETDGHIIYVVYIRSEIEGDIKKILDPCSTVYTDYRMVMVAREAWRTLLQLLADYKSHKQ